ncbi:MAG: HEAT repeat domain-containing protein [Chitinispirillaceae bacterium]|nr:HEAT repeat domain-containing protein [Chitinispirillaceae bacterium]
MRTSSKQPVAISRFLRLIVGTGAALLMSYAPCNALTRWSAVRLVPDADLLEGGTFVLDAQGYYFSDITDGATVKPVGLVNFGVIEWINIETGYTGGFTLGLKARILGETKPWMPSLALGVRNIFSHREAWFFDRKADELANEVYCVFGKSVEAARLRFHIGIQSIPRNKREQFNPFGVIEKYFGSGLYVTAEVHRRDRLVHPSLFAAWRFWKRRIEISTGVIDIAGMFINDDVPPNSRFYKSSDSRFVRPGVWFGVRFRGGIRIGKTDGLTGLESSLHEHSTSIEALRGEVDSLKRMLRGSLTRLENLDRSVARITDSSLTDEGRLMALAVDRLAVLNNLYDAEPFEPEAVNKAMAELTANRDRMLSSLYEIINDPVREIRKRTLAITALGEIGTQAAADVIIEVLGQSPGPEMTIECLIALGKMKETRAVYLMQQLSNDPNDDIAFAAAEVLQKLEKETGVAVTPVTAAQFAPVSIPEKKIGSGETYEPREEPKPVPQPKRAALQKVAPPPKNDSTLRKAERPEFMETTVAPPEVAAKEQTKPAPNPPAKVKVEGKQPPVGKPVPAASAVAAEKKTGPDTAAAPVAPAEKVAGSEKKTDQPEPAQEQLIKQPGKTAKVKQPAPTPKTKKSEEKQPPSRKRIDMSKETW